MNWTMARRWRTTGLIVICLAAGNAACTHSGMVLEGRVLDANHRPARGAHVFVVNSAEGYIDYFNPERVIYNEDRSSYPSLIPLRSVQERNGRCAARMRTDRDGRFRVAGLSADAYHLLAVHPEQGLRAVGDINLPDADLPLEIELSEPTFITGKIHGYKRGKSGWLYQAYENIHLRLLEADDDALHLKNDSGETVVNLSRHSFEIGPDGDFHIGPLPAGGLWRFSIDRLLVNRFTSADILSLPVILEAGRINALEVDLRKDCRLSGRVLGPDGQPLRETSITATSDADESAPESAENRYRRYGALTDRNGNFAIRGVPPGKYVLHAYRNSRRPWDSGINPAHFCGGTYLEFEYQRDIDVAPEGASPLEIRIERFNDAPR